MIKERCAIRMVRQRRLAIASWRLSTKSNGRKVVKNEEIYSQYKDFNNDKEFIAACQEQAKTFNKTA